MALWRYSTIPISSRRPAPTANEGVPQPDALVGHAVLGHLQGPLTRYGERRKEWRGRMGWGGVGWGGGMGWGRVGRGGRF